MCKNDSLCTESVHEESIIGYSQMIHFLSKQHKLW